MRMLQKPQFLCHGKIGTQVVGRVQLNTKHLEVIPNRFLVISYDSINSYNCGGGSQAGDWQIIFKRKFK